MPLTDDLLAAILFDVAKPHKYVAPQERGAIPLLIGQYRCLEQLDKADGISQQELADALGIRPASLSELLSKLEQKGHIKRSPSERDRRCLLVYLTDAGRVTLSENIRSRRQLHADIFSPLSAEEKETLYSILRKIVKPREDDPRK